MKKTAILTSLISSLCLPVAGQEQSLQTEADLTVWIATNPVPRKVRQMRNDPRVTLLYFEPEGQGYVTIVGTATLANNPVEKAKY